MSIFTDKPNCLSAVQRLAGGQAQRDCQRRKSLSAVWRFVTCLTGLAVGLSGVLVAAPATAGRLVSGSSASSATPINFGQNVNGAVTATAVAEWYRITLPTSGAVDIDFTGNLRYVDLAFYTAVPEQIYRSHREIDWNSLSGVGNFADTVYLNSGTYYFVISEDSYYQHRGTYNFTLKYTSSAESAKETQLGSNNSHQTASAINLDTQYKGQLSSADDPADFYKITLPASGRINISFTSNIQYADFVFYTEVPEQISRIHREIDWNSISGVGNYTDTIYLNSGTYYFAISKDDYYNKAGMYTFTLSYKSAEESFKETQMGTDNTYKTANAINLGTQYKGQLSYAHDEADFYKFTLAQSGKVHISATTAQAYADFRIYTAVPKEIWVSHREINWNTISLVGSFSTDVVLSSGTYYFAVSHDNYYSSTGFYSFRLSIGASITLNLKGGTGEQTPLSAGVGEKIGKLPTPKRTGYKFLGWFTAKGQKVTSSTIVTGNMSLTARWQAKTYTVKFSAVGGKLAKKSRSKKVTYGKAYGKLPKPKRKGHKFLGWFTAKAWGSKVTAKTKLKSTGTQKLYAHWR
jgi:uncharacterized repeat protein (TIGR02543 family)